MALVLFVMVVVVMLLLWGTSGYAPDPVQRFAAKIVFFEQQLIHRVHMAWQGLRGRNDYTGHGVLGESKMDTLRRKPNQIQINQRMATRVLAPPQNDEERRMFFLHEVQLHTELTLNITEDDVLHISKRDMKTLTEYCTLYANPVGEPKRLFLLHGIRISVEKNPQDSLVADNR